jgi:hypothetical protein
MEDVPLIARSREIRLVGSSVEDGGVLLATVPKERYKKHRKWLISCERCENPYCSLRVQKIGTHLAMLCIGMWGPLATLSSCYQWHPGIGGVGPYNSADGRCTLAKAPRNPAISRANPQTHAKRHHPPNDDRRTVVNNLPERQPSAVGYQVTRQHAADGIMQRLGAMEQGRNFPPIPSPRSETPDTIEAELFWSASPINSHNEDLNRVSSPGESTMNPPESPVIAVPRISIHADDSVPSEGSSFTVVDSPDSQRPAWADGTGTTRRARGTSNSRGIGDARNDRGASDSRDSRGDSGMRGVGDASWRKAEPQYESPGQRTHTDDRDHPALLSARTDRATLGLRPIEQTPSRSSSIRRKGTTLKYNRVL